MELKEINLENLSLTELNSEQIQQVEGGYWPKIGWWMDCGFSYGSGSGGVPIMSDRAA